MKRHMKSEKACHTMRDTFATSKGSFPAYNKELIQINMSKKVRMHMTYFFKEFYPKKL
jgi:hypothetical protein